MEDTAEKKLSKHGPLGGIVHSMNNTLAVIRGFSQILLMRKTLDAGVRKDIEAIAESGKKLSDLVEQLSVIAEQEAAKRE